MKQENNDNKDFDSQKFKPIQMSKEQSKQLAQKSIQTLELLKQEMKEKLIQQEHSPDCVLHHSVDFLDKSINFMNQLNPNNPNKSGQKVVESAKDMMKFAKNMLSGLSGAIQDGEEDNGDNSDDKIGDINQQVMSAQAVGVEMLNRSLAHMQMQQKIQSQIQKLSESSKFILENVFYLQSLNQEILLYDYLMNCNFQVIFAGTKNISKKIEVWLEASFQTAQLGVVESLNHILDVFKEAQDIENSDLPNLIKFTNEFRNFHIAMINAQSGLNQGQHKLKMPNEQEKRERLQLMQTSQLQTFRSILTKLQYIPQIDLVIEKSVFETQVNQQQNPIKPKIE